MLWSHDVLTLVQLKRLMKVEVDVIHFLVLYIVFSVATMKDGKDCCFILRGFQARVLPTVKEL